MLSATPPRPHVATRRLGTLARCASSVNSDVLIQVYTGSRIPFGVLSKTSLLLATVFGRAVIEDSVDERQRLGVSALVLYPNANSTVPISFARRPPSADHDAIPAATDDVAAGEGHEGAG